MTPGTSFRSPTIKLPRSKKLFFIISAASCGPLMASTAAHWLICEAQESVFVIQRVITGARVRLAT